MASQFIKVTSNHDETDMWINVDKILMVKLLKDQTTILYEESDWTLKVKETVEEVLELIHQEALRYK
ncbi:MAG: hypothetical protein OEY59_08390 [Deltaproteobacteria bacterium]|nr:hypothetical protein [Deltaproteobacteria bacterium]